MQICFMTIFIVIIFCQTCFDACASSKNRRALLIGNAEYSINVGALKNPVNDTNLLKKSFEKIDYNVKVINNASRAAMLREINAFARALREEGEGAIGIIYYSGHGVSRPDYNTNYLIPVDVVTMRDHDIWWNAISLEAISSELKSTAPKSSTFIILDACRNQLILDLKGGGKGFNRLSDENGIFVALATSPNTTASDEGETAGPYATALGEELKVPGQNHLNLFQRVKERVFQSTRGIQRPWESNGLLYPVIINNLPETKRDTGKGTQKEDEQTNGKKTSNVASSPTDLKGEAGSFCNDLNKLVKLSSSDFSAIRSTSLANNLWRSQFNFHDFDRCEIKKMAESSSYICYSDFTISRVNLIKSMEKFVNLASACLGSSWKTTRNKSDAEEIMHFVNPDEKAAVTYAVQEGGEYGREALSYPSFYLSMRVKNKADDSMGPNANGGKELFNKNFDYCSNLKLLIERVSNNVSSIISYNQNEEMSIPKIKLPGWNDCSIYSYGVSGKGYINCELSQLQDEKSADQFAETLSNDTKNCLGKEWVTRVSGYRSGRKGYSLSTTGVPLEIQIRYGQAAALWRIILDFNF